ncbi:dihydrofolate reductase [Nonomuraea sp. NN258]|uniref:dihydrofolate reductase family protein n=1 Tax=Nonomuraea antri TaxID=2730852 RepID=UPI00156A1DD0|nr:dihydrofolate reductase family protein [Nonomuraea antri]NRQ33248.1 dihydrofolate reductase [Nonomuraea antri]
MRRLVVTCSLSLDGVMQAPAGPDEDRRGGFEHGGWAPPYGDEVMFKAMTGDMGGTDALLFGRWTYESFRSFWPHQKDDVFADKLNATRKYVVSTTLREPLPWAGSTLVQGDVPRAVAALKREPGGDILVLGSGTLVQSLMRHDLIDVYVLLVHPLTLGAGRRLFPDDGPRLPLRLADSVVTSTGVIVATYERDERA